MYWQSHPRNTGQKPAVAKNRCNVAFYVELQAHVALALVSRSSDVLRGRSDPEVRHRRASRAHALLSPDAFIFVPVSTFSTKFDN